MKNKDFKNLRKRVIETVLSTDIIYHSKIIDTMTFKFALEADKEESKEFNMGSYLEENKDITKFEAQQNLINFVVHCADINHPAKSFSLHKKWTDLIYKEFFNQGDLEKKLNMEISPLSDRETTDITIGQINFITEYVLTSYEILSCLLNKTSGYCRNIESNLNEWKVIKDGKDEEINEEENEEENEHMEMNDEDGDENEEENEDEN